jgi:hypothetical protein
VRHVEPIAYGDDAVLAGANPTAAEEADMALAVIGAGLGRTGTASLKSALEALGLGPCHHMSEVISNPEQKAIWRAAAGGEPIDWDHAYAGYRSAVDWPTAHYWRQLAAYYPGAKVILTTRDPADWYRSAAATIGRTWAPGSDQASFGVRVISNIVFSGRFEDREHAIAVYEAHNAEVRASIPPARLLDYDVAQGWEPLCQFLGKPVPAGPFPHSNTTAEFQARAR